MKSLSLLLVAGTLATAHPTSQAQAGLNTGGLQQIPGVGALQTPVPGRGLAIATPQDAATLIPYQPIGASPSGAGADTSHAWFIDLANNRVILCSRNAAAALGCEAARIPAPCVSS